MTNYEFYKEEIEMRYRECTPFALTKQNCIASCKIIDCEECVFSCYNNPETRGLRCGDRKMMWAVQEHVEKPKLTKKERKFCELFEGKNIWLAKGNRDGERDLVPYIFTSKPERKTSSWYGYMLSTASMRKFCDINFSFIKWEDEPWHINDLLALEVED